MTRPPDDANQSDLIAGYVLGDLSPEEEARLRQLLSASPAQVQEANSLEAALALLPYALPTVEPSAHLKDKILQAASNASSTPARETPASKAIPNVIPLKQPAAALPPQQKWQQWMPLISSGIAAVAVAALGLNYVQLGRQSQQTVALQQQLENTNKTVESLRSELNASQKITALLDDPQTQVYSLVGEASNQTNSKVATARMLIKPGETEVTLVAQNLPQLPEDEIYRFWSLTEASPTPQYCGQFHQDSSGTAQWNSIDAACTINPLQMMITLESPAAPITEPGPVVMESII